MLNTIKFSILIVNNENEPMQDQIVHCLEVSKSAKAQAMKQKTNEEGKADFVFESARKSIEIDIEVSGNTFNYEFQDQDLVTLKLFTDDNLNIFLELLLANKEIGL